MKHLLARHAEAIFWLARYVERAEDLARVLDVNQTFNRDSRGAHDWRVVLRIYGEEERFAALGREPSAANVIAFYALDQGNVASIVCAIRAARENARSLRPLISTEMWTQLNTFYNRVMSLTAEDLAEGRLARTFAVIKEGCQTHTGITEGTFYRDEGWLFYQLGRAIERADQTTYLLDVKSSQVRLAESAGEVTPDLGEWMALLRSAASFHAYRRVHGRHMAPHRVAHFMLFDRDNPRSVRHCLVHVDGLLSSLARDYGVRVDAETGDRLDELRSILDHRSIESVITSGLGAFLDGVQRELMGITDRLSRRFFG